MMKFYELAVRVRFSLLLIFMMFGALPTLVSAQTEIDIDDTTRLVFNSGNFDVRRYSGTMHGFSYYVNDVLTLRADKVSIETAGAIDDNNFYVASLRVTKGEIVGEGVTFAELNLNDIDFGVMMATYADSSRSGRMTDVGPGLSDKSHLQINGLEVVSDDATFSIDSFVTLGLAFDHLPDGKRYFKNAGVMIDGLAINLSQVNSDLQDLADLLRGRGINRLTFDIAMAQKIKAEAGVLHVEHAANLEMQELASLEMVTNFDVGVAAFSTLERMQSNSDAMDEAFAMLDEISVAAVNATYLDDGLVDILVELAANEQRMSNEQMRDLIRGGLVQAAEGTLPRNGVRLVQPVDDLIKQGGGLELTINPAQPVVLSGFLGFLIMPDLALDQLGVTLTYLRKN